MSNRFVERDKGEYSAVKGYASLKVLQKTRREKRPPPWGKKEFLQEETMMVHIRRRLGSSGPPNYVF